MLGQGSLLDKIQNTAFERLEMIPSEVDLCGADIELARSDNHLQRVTQALQPVLDSQRFDVVLVDCPPSLGILTLNAFVAADGVLVPLAMRILRAGRHFHAQPDHEPVAR